MSSGLLTSSDRFYRLLLRVYPAEFQERFAAEMAQVFRSACQEAYTESGASGLAKLWLPMLWDWVWAAIYQWGSYLMKRKGEIMLTRVMNQGDGIGPLPLAQAGLAVLPFLLFGLTMILGKLAFFLPEAVRHALTSYQIYNPYLIFIGLLLAGLFVSLITGFPRWGYSYLGWALLVGWLQSNQVSGDKISQLFWPLLVGIVLIALLVRRSLQPLNHLLMGIWQDWTILSFAVYIIFSFFLMIYDENHNPYLYLLMTATTLGLSLGVWGYFRSATPLRRVLSLVGGLLLTVIISIIDNLTWDFAAYYHLPKSANDSNLGIMTFFAVLSLIMIGNGLLAFWRSRRKMLVPS